MDFFVRLFDTDFAARSSGGCAGWTREVLLLHNVSDLLIFGAYLAIPAILVFLLWRKVDAPFPVVLWAFAAFILTCGATHLLDCVSCYYPFYRFTGAVKLLCAAASWGTVVALFPAIPKILRMRNTRELEEEIAKRKETEHELESIRDNLGFRVAERTRDVQMSEARWRSLIELAPDAIIVADLNGKITEVNAAACRLLGYHREHFLAMGRSDLIREQDKARLEERRMSMLSTSEPNSDTEWVFRRADGSLLDVDVSSTIIPSGVWLSIIRDVSARKRQEEAQERLTQQLRESDQAKDEFLAMLSHELRNPLAPITNALEVMRIASSDPADTVLGNARAMIERQTAHMVRLVDDLLDVSRITMGKVHLKCERITVAAAIRHAVDSCASTIEAKRHTIHTDVPESLAVWADGTRLTQILLNIINNACKYMSGGGNIYVKVWAEDNDVSISIRDEGMGIHKDVLPRVFDLFAQAVRGYDRAEGGLGIGLTLVRRLVEMHGGTVTASSSGLGQGAEFVVRLPLYTAGVAAAPQPEQHWKVATPKKILVIDDNADSTVSMSMVLEMHGHTVWSATDPQEGIALALLHQPEVVLLDIGMPGMDGYKVIERLRQEDSMGSTRFVAMTGYGGAADREATGRAGFVAHLVKPVDMTSLTNFLSDI